MSRQETGPIYGVPLIDSLPLDSNCGMLQAMPKRSDLEDVQTLSVRTVAGYEVLLSHYLKNQQALAQVFELAMRMNQSGTADRCRAGNDILDFLNRCGFKETT